jgi:hypothetical protein
MRKASSDRLLDPDHRDRRPKKKRGTIHLQVRRTDGCEVGHCFGPGGKDWTPYCWRKYRTLRDAEQAVAALSAGFWGRNGYEFRVDPQFRGQ